MAEIRSGKRSKPAKTLSQLEEEPQTGFFGLTYTEVNLVFRKCLLVIVLATLVLMVFIRWEIAAIVSIFTGCGYGWMIIVKMSSRRAGKPLFYHVHIRTWRSRRFIQPGSIVRFQRERNPYAGPK